MGPDPAAAASTPLVARDLAQNRTRQRGHATPTRTPDIILALAALALINTPLPNLNVSPGRNNDDRKTAPPTPRPDRADRALPALPLRCLRVQHPDQRRVRARRPLAVDGDAVARRRGR